MNRFTVILWVVLFISSCKNYIPNTEKAVNWGEARWIALEKLEDSLKIVPAVHGSGDQLGEKGIKRSVVPMFRNQFSLDKPVESALIHISGMGHYELSVNGNKVGDQFLSPGWTLYQKRIFYNTYDISPYLKTGENAIGVMVGNGFYHVNRERYRKLVVAYGYPKLIFSIEIKFSDGTSTQIVSGKECRVAPSPVTFSSIYGGEDYDATLEQEGWNTAGFDDSNWSKPIILEDGTEILFPEEDFPLKVMQEFTPANRMTSKSGRTIYDFGQNASGIISLKVKGNRGARIKIRPDELIDQNGDVTQRSGGGPYEWNYTLKGGETEEWQPRFTYYGFRYADVEITEPEGASTPTEIEELKMLHIRNSAPTVGSFCCSDTLFNQIFDLILWGIKSNMASVATDCPHREKLGWLEQTYLIGPSMHYNFNIHSLYRKIVYDMMDSQLENGLVPDIAPEYVPFQSGFRDSPEWGSASVIIPWQLYRWYGDTQILREAYPMMKRYVEYLRDKSENFILDYGLGDWYDLGPKHPGEAQLTPKAVTATTIFYYNLQLVCQTAKLLGYETDAQAFSELAGKVQKAFLEKFYNPKTGECSTGSQTAYGMPLYTGIIPAGDREKVFSNLVDSIRNNDYALTSGDIGYHFLVRVLSENGRSDLLYKMNNRSDRPGYGYQLKKGATALTESWAALTDVSNNHMMLGHLMEWFYSGLGGIYQKEKSVAYENIVIAPKPTGDISWVNCSFESPKGIISSEWRLENNWFTLDATIPEKTTAEIVLPDGFKESTCKVINIQSGKPEKIRWSDSRFSLKPGRYSISCEKSEK
jgi:hypothetical protein